MVITIITVTVNNNNVEQAMRVLKKKMQREGTIRLIKEKRYYEKPCEKSARKQAEARRRANKARRKRLEILGF